MTGNVTEYDIETWYCCRPWPIVVAVRTWSKETDSWEVQRQWLHPCKLCNNMPVSKSEAET